MFSMSGQPAGKRAFVRVLLVKGRNGAKLKRSPRLFNAITKFSTPSSNPQIRPFFRTSKYSPYFFSPISAGKRDPDRSFPVQMAADAVRAVFPHRNHRAALGFLLFGGNQLPFPRRPRDSEAPAAVDHETAGGGLLRAADGVGADGERVEGGGFERESVRDDPENQVFGEAAGIDFEPGGERVLL